MNSTEKAIGVRGEVDTCRISLQVEHSPNERRILARKPVVLLARSGARLDVIDGAEAASPVKAARKLRKLGVLHHHRMDDPQERLVAGEDGCSARQGVALPEALTCVPREYLNHAYAVGTRVLAPLEVASRIIQHGTELVALELVWRENAKGSRILGADLLQKLTRLLHAAVMMGFVDGKLLPWGQC